MKLQIENAPDKEKTFQEAFSILSRAYGIENEDVTVHLRFESRPAIEKVAHIFIFEVKAVEYEGGATRSKFWIDSFGKRHAFMYLNEAARPDKLKDQTQMKTFAHEMRHVMQMVKNQLEQNWRGESVWFGKVVDLTYKDQPWELDADTASNQVYPLIKHLEKQA